MGTFLWWLWSRVIPGSTASGANGGPYSFPLPGWPVYWEVEVERVVQGEVGAWPWGDKSGYSSQQPLA